MDKISWKALEYKKKERTTDWYWAVMILAISIVVISIILKDYLFSILIIISTISILIFSQKNPKELHINIDRRGVIVEKKMYPFANLESFWVDITETNNHKVILRLKKNFMPLIIIPLEEIHHLDIRDFLLNFLQEEEMHEPLAQKIMDKLGF